MRTASSRTILVALLAAAGTAAAAAEDVAVAPELRVGDWWAFHETGVDDSGSAVDRYWRRRVEEILADGKFRVAPRYNGQDLFDASWNPIFPDRDFSPLVFRFPLSADSAWTYASRIGARMRSGHGYYNGGQMKVVAYESITVPAGTFKCFRIEGESLWVAEVDPTQPDFFFSERWRTTNWYCPEVRYLGKSRSERFSGGAFGRHSVRTLDSELVDFRRRSTAVSATAQADAVATAALQPSPFDGVWAGEQGIWRINGRIAGERIEGTLQCLFKGVWSTQPARFAGTVARDGSVDAETVDEPAGWAPRRIRGAPPKLSIIGYGALSCPNGEVAMKRAEGEAIQTN